MRTQSIHKRGEIMGEKDTRIDRRDFLKSTTTTAAAAAGFMIVRPEAVRGTAANSAVQLGIIGCGGRGTSVASSMMENTNLRVVAIADVFQDRLDAGNQRFSDLAQEKNFSKISRRQLFRGSNEAPPLLFPILSMRQPFYLC